MMCDANSFELNPSNTGDNSLSKTGTQCSEDYIYIEASNQSGVGQGGIGVMDRYCGGILNNLQGFAHDVKIRDCTSPFEVGVVTDNTNDVTAGGGVVPTQVNEGSGICLTYTQEPCSAGNQGP